MSQLSGMQIDVQLLVIAELPSENGALGIQSRNVSSPQSGDPRSGEVPLSTGNGAMRIGRSPVRYGLRIIPASGVASRLDMSKLLAFSPGKRSAMLYSLTRLGSCCSFIPMRTFAML